MLALRILHSSPCIVVSKTFYALTLLLITYSILFLLISGRNEKLTIDADFLKDLSKHEFEREQFLLTASTDCTIKLWLLPQGSLVKSIYNYSPIARLCYSNGVIFCGKTDNACISFCSIHFSYQQVIFPYHLLRLS